MKSFGRTRLLGRCWRIILDGTGLFYFREKHCDNCLTKTITMEDGTKVKTYYHKVLEAKLVLGEKIVISIDTEFIENETETVAKQDCEINAAKRLLKRIAGDYPRLPICIQGDSLYAVEPIMEICHEKTGDIYLRIKRVDRSSCVKVTSGSDKVEVQLKYRESVTKEERVNISTTWKKLPEKNRQQIYSVMSVKRKKMERSSRSLSAG